MVAWNVSCWEEEEKVHRIHGAKVHEHGLVIFVKEDVTLKSEKEMEKIEQA